MPHALTGWSPGHFSPSKPHTFRLLAYLRPKSGLLTISDTTAAPPVAREVLNHRAYGQC